MNGEREEGMSEEEWSRGMEYRNGVEERAEKRGRRRSEGGVCV